MEIDTPQTATERAEESFATFKATIAKQPFYYFAVELVVNGTSDQTIDAYQFHSYFTAVLKEWLGIIGSGMSVDILDYQYPVAIIRVPFDKYKGVWQAMTVNTITLLNGSVARFKVVRGSAFYMGVVTSSRSMF
ncbi:hypothetical protein GGF40_002128 [Coemansia sp. RSA 1286]|nr:hypothetical protein IWW45_004255 [Coemansia sp. RSA 485]KAJ2637772.1 hypothetical protein GGF40_002128 [Coemansia sp. RSA 1286]